MITLIKTASDNCEDKHHMSTEKQKTVIINGHRYDATTGLPIGPAKSAKETKPEVKSAPKKPSARAATVKPAAPVPGKRPVSPRSSHAVHISEPQRSQTLNRRVARKTTKQETARPKAPTRTGQVMDVARSSRIARFAPHPTEAKTTATDLHTSVQDRPHRAHPIVRRAAQNAHHAKPASHPHAHVAPTHTQQATPVTSQEIKNAAIAQALSAEPTPQPKLKKSHRGRNFLIAFACVAVILGAAYVTFMNLPVLSVSLASAQAGIKASYPSYVPDGYRLEQPITFDEGEVSLKFLSNSGGGGYTVTQERSSWDSSAVLTNIVQKSAGDDYSTIKNSGLTIYTYRGNAAWVNAGILYTVTNDGTLSSQQVNDIAASL